ncbi:hypothetical protein Dm11a5_0814 [Dehalococcoides mccartyi]|jgi:hypothetical protein|uniref:Uncharacterized protein n=1 Tax=Dehalococcoides mccartyi TaxID=61435 RepID=A0A142V9X9_9CHLR|nr:hypothetical protein Dm11a5_0814 [Dehalococcoides mccartyi]
MNFLKTLATDLLKVVIIVDAKNAMDKHLNMYKSIINYGFVRMWG